MKKKRKRAGKRRRWPCEEEVMRRCDEIIELTDCFCDKHLNEDYQELCSDMVEELYGEGFPLYKGRAVGWAAGVVHAIGWVNFLQDPQQSPHMTSVQVAEGFGISQGTMMAKSKIIRDELDLIRLDPDWCVPAMLEKNPLAWMLQVNGFIMDARDAPREVQEEAYRLGLIPYIPADKQERKLESGTGTNIIEFPSGRNEDSRSKSRHKTDDDTVSLFETLEE